MLYPKISPYFLKIGSFELRWYGLAYLLGFLLGFLLVKPELKKKFGLSSDEAMTFLTWLIAGVIVGGRVGYVLFYDFGYYLSHLLEIVALWHGGMSFHGGVIGVCVALFWFSKQHNISFLGLMDLVAWVAPLGIFFGRVANFVNGELYGRISTVPWAMVFPNGGPFLRHPSQLYEALGEGLILFLLLTVLKFRSKTPGVLLGVAFVLYGSIRFFLEFFREPDAQLGFVLASLSMGQLLCLAMISFGLVLGLSQRRQR